MIAVAKQGDAVAKQGHASAEQGDVGAKQGERVLEWMMDFCLWLITG